MLDHRLSSWLVRHLCKFDRWSLFRSCQLLLGVQLLDLLLIQVQEVWFWHAWFLDLLLLLVRLVEVNQLHERHLVVPDLR